MKRCFVYQFTFFEYCGIGQIVRKLQKVQRVLNLSIQVTYFPKSKETKTENKANTVGYLVGPEKKTKNYEQQNSLSVFTKFL